MIDESTIKPGDLVRLLEPRGGMPVGHITTVLAVTSSPAFGDARLIQWRSDNGLVYEHYTYRFEAVMPDRSVVMDKFVALLAAL